METRGWIRLQRRLSLKRRQAARPPNREWACVVADFGKLFVIRFSSPDFLDFNERGERRIEPIYLHYAVKLCKNNSYFFFFFPLVTNVLIRYIGLYRILLISMRSRKED